MIRGRVWAAATAIAERDPAAHSAWEVLLFYPGFHALGWYRVSHWLHRHHRYLLAALIASLGRFFTRVDIHPAARLGRRIFIDHGAGVVIGATAVVEDDVTILHGVTLGSSAAQPGPGPRHPKVGRHAFIGAHAQLLGPITVGAGAKVGANAVVLHDVPAGRTVVGNPGRLVAPKLAAVAKEAKGPDRALGTRSACG